MDTTFMYRLKDPETKEVRYVGRADNPQKRLSQHLRDTRECHKVHWLRQLKRRGLTPLMEVIEEVSVIIWPERECYWIAYHLAQGCRLTNMHPGGIGGSISPSAETRAKISAANKGRKQSPETIAKRAAKQRNPSPETRAKFSARSKGRVLSAVSRAKVAAAKRGKKRGPLSEEWKRNIGNAFRGKSQPPELIAKRAAALKGREHSAETRAKIGASNRGKTVGRKRAPFSEEWRQNISAAKKGTKASDETKAKMSEARRGRAVSDETKAKIAEANRGKKRPDVKPNLGKSPSAETRAKISASLTGKKLSPESIAKRTEKIQGRKHTPEAREKMAEAARQRWAARKAKQTNEG